MASSLLDGLPESPSRGRVQRLLGFYLAWFIGAVALIALALRAETPLSGVIALGVFFSTFVMHFTVVIVTILLRGQATRALVRAESLIESAPAAAFLAVSQAIKIGLAGDRHIRSWLVAARYAEEYGALADADEALRRSLLATPGRGRLTPSVVRTARLRRAFVQAALGRFDEAEQEIASVRPDELADPRLRAEYTRSRALLLYRTGRLREVVDLAASADATAFGERDRALLAALEQSSMLRLEGGGAPMRVAEPPVHEEWIDRLVPELRSHGRP